MFGHISTRKKIDLLEREIAQLKDSLLRRNMDISLTKGTAGNLLSYFFKDKVCPVCGKRMKFSARNSYCGLDGNTYSLTCDDDGIVVSARDLIELEEKLNALAAVKKEDK